MPPADSHCLKTRIATRLLTGCVSCTLYLVFKEPTVLRQWRLTRHRIATSSAPTAQVLPGRPRRLSAAARLGEPCEVTIGTTPCQPLNCNAQKILETVAA